MFVHDVGIIWVVVVLYVATTVTFLVRFDTVALDTIVKNPVAGESLVIVMAAVLDPTERL